MTHIDAPPDGSGELRGLSSDGRLERVLKSSQFAITAELAPPDSADPEDVYERARLFDGCVDAINATDGSGANCHMSSVGVCALLSRQGYSMVMQVTCRDRNRIAIQGDVLGAAAMGVTNILCLTGDGVQAGDEPEAKPVFDLDSVSLLRAVRMMRDDAHFLTRRPLSTPPRVFLGASVNPFVPPHDFQIHKLEKKIDAGAQFIQTQYCYDLPMLEDFMAQVRARELHRRAYILVGVGVPSSAQSARWMREHIPGLHIPDSIIERLERAGEPRDEGARICVETLQALRDIEGVAGAHIMAYKREADVAGIIDRSGVLADRELR
ncbi:5,10-methylenetetrahydrofolate reductase [Methylohalomonas lacus]|uniref:Methylenetetrahydrofolate reductase n=1 Tax=Methylohalomonas lacus TaxID=398773 RepID=A0AAE3L1H9_9GAMM|nr:methylenetetrahydrofolate reductase [Methylohalomonas lacus]MCS3904074.1 5,10-methylenetetrahydrofolate reductase [Methylohalomonas lacus]